MDRPSLITEDIIIERLIKLRSIPPRDPQHAAHGRAEFLMQVRDMKKITSFQATPAAGNQPQTEWVTVLQTLFGRSKRNAITFPVITVIIVAIFLFGGIGVTAHAAQNSLPVDALYPMKTFTENVSYLLAIQAQNRLDLILSFAERRVGEMAAMAGSKIPVPAGAAVRLGAQVETALNLASGLDRTAQRASLVTILARMLQQEQVLAVLVAANPDDVQLARALRTMEEQINLAALGLNEPASLQLLLEQRSLTRPWEVVSPASGAAERSNTNNNDNPSSNENSTINSNSNNKDVNGTDDLANTNSGNKSGNEDLNANAGADGDDDQGTADGDDGNTAGDDEDASRYDAGGGDDDAGGGDDDAGEDHPIDN